MNRRIVLFSMLAFFVKPNTPQLKNGDMVTIICDGPYKRQLDSFKKHPYKISDIIPSFNHKYENTKVQSIYGHEDTVVLNISDCSTFHIPISLVKRA